YGADPTSRQVRARDRIDSAPSSGRWRGRSDQRSEGKMNGKTISRCLRASFLGTVVLGGCNHLLPSQGTSTLPDRPGTGSAQAANASYLRNGAQPGAATAKKPLPSGGGAGGVVAAAKSSSQKGQAVARNDAAQTGTQAASGPGYGHAEDYTWLSGQVEQWGHNKIYRLRYASVDETDAHGGSVTL